MIDLRRRCRTETDVGHQISRVARVQKVPRLSEEWMLLQPVKMDQKIQTKKNWVGSVWMSGAESATPLPDSSPQPDVLPSFWLIVINYSHRCRRLVIWVGIYLRIGMNRICSSRCGGSASGTGGWIPTDLEPIGSNNDGEELSAVIFGANQWFFQGKGGRGRSTGCSRSAFVPGRINYLLSQSSESIQGIVVRTEDCCKTFP